MTRIPRRVLLLAIVSNSLAWTLSAPVRARGADDAVDWWPRTAAQAEHALSTDVADLKTADDWTRRAWALSRWKSDHAGATEAARRALAIDPDHPKAIEIAGLIAQMRGAYEDAFAHYLKLISMGRPESDLYLSRMAALNLSRPQREQLIKTLLTVCEGGKADAVYRAQARAAAANMLVAAGRMDQALHVGADLGFLRDWMLIGPFSNEQNAGFGQEYGPEMEIDYGKKYQGRDRDVGWERLRHVTPGGHVDFEEVVYPNSNVLAYVLTYVHVEEDVNAVLRFGAANAVKAWVNDLLLVSNDEDVTMVFDQYAAPCVLRKGWNKILFKVCERHGQWRLAARLTRADGTPLAARTDAAAGEPIAIRKTPVEKEPARFDWVRGCYDHFVERCAADKDDPAAAYYLAQAESMTARKMRACSTYERLIRLDDACSDHHAMQARAYLADEKPEKALVAFKKALAIEPKHVECLADLGRFYDDRNLFEKALSTLREAAKLSPDWPDAQYYLMQVYRGKRWDEHVWRQAEWLLARAPTVPWVLQEYAGLCMGRGFREKARTYYEKLLHEDYDNESARRALIGLAVDERRIEDALEQYGILLKLRPVSVGLHLSKADLLMEHERYEEAMAEIDAALDVCGASFAAHRMKGTLLQRMGRDADAIAAWKVALKYNPDDQWMREYLEFLEPETIAAFARYGVSTDEAEEIVKKRVKPADYPKADAVTLLSQLVVELNEDASYTALEHRIVQILTDSGRQQFTTMSTGGWDAKIKRAVVIQPDGSEVEASRVSGGSVRFGQLQVGSLIELKAQYRGSSNEWLDRHYTHVFAFQTDNPMVRARYVLLVPPMRKIRHMIQGELVKLEQGEFDGKTVYDFHAEDVPMLEPESNRPPYMDIANLVRVTTIEDWEEIARWEYSLIKDQFVADEAVRRKAENLTEDLSSREERIRAVANFVMQKIQYRQDYDRMIMGMKPHKVGNVLEKQVGDCKDKANLLITMLREQGIPAHYVTLRTRRAGKLVREIPSNQCDHAIVYVPDPDDFERGLFIDGTANYSGIDTLPWQDQGIHAMVFRDDGRMVFMKTPVDSPDRSLNNMHIDARIDPDGSAHVFFRWIASGQFAAALRQAFEAEGLRRQRLEQFVNGIFSGAKVTSIQFGALDDRDQPVRIEFEFDCPSFAQVAGDKLVIPPRGLIELARTYANRSDRTYDVWLPYPRTQRFVQIYRPPPGYKLEAPRESVNLETRHLDFTEKTTTEERKTRIETILRFKSIEIPKADYQRLRNFCIEVDSHERRPLGFVRSDS